MGKSVDGNREVNFMVGDYATQKHDEPIFGILFSASASSSLSESVL